MSVTNQTTKVGPFEITGSPQVIPVTFAFQQASDLLVLDYGTSAVTHDPALVLVLNSDYTVTGGGYNLANQMQDGSITVVSSGSSGVSTGDNIVIMRAAPLNQTESFSATGPLTIRLLEQMGDKLATLSQQVNELGERSLHFENFETISGNLSRTARAGYLLGFDDNGNIQYSTSSGGSGQTYTAGAGLLLAANEFSVDPDQSLDNLTVANPISADLSGNASTATALATARNINGVPFDGTANITVTAAAGTLTGTALPVGVTSAPGLSTVAVGTLASMATQAASAVAITGGTITGMPSPSAGSDVATKTYVDNTSTGIVQRTGCQVATTANVTLSGEQTIDGVLTSTSRILVKNQTAPAENGIYVTAAGAWSRATDSNTAGELLVGYYYFVSLGTTQGATGWTIQTAPTNLGVDPVVFGQFSASTTYTNGTGLDLTGNVFSIKAAQSGLAITGSTFNGTVGATTPSTGAFTQTTTTGNTFAGNLVIKSGQLNEAATNATAAVQINYDGYAGGTTQFRDLTVYDGKNAIVASFTGSTKGASLVGPVSLTSGSVSMPATNTFMDLIGGTTGTAAGRLILFGSTHATLPSQAFLDGDTITFRAADHSTTRSVLTSSGLALTGAYSVNSNTNIRTTKTNFHIKEVNVMDYGALGDGSTDDTSAFNSAIAALTDYSVLLVPPTANFYKVTAAFTIFANLDYVRVTGGGTIKNTNTGASQNMFEVATSCTHVSFDHINLLAAATVRGNGIGIRMYGNYGVIENCYIDGFSDFGVHVSGTYNVGTRVQNNTIANTLGDGVHIGGATDCIVSGNNFLNTGDDSIGLIADDPSYQPNRVLVVGNLIYNSGSRGIVAEEVVDVKISNNEIYESVLSPIRVGRYTSTTAYNSRVVVSDNKTYLGNSTVGPLGAIWIEFANECTVMGNQVTAPHNGNGIAFLDVNNFVAKKNIIQQCPSRGIGSDDTTTSNVSTSWSIINISENLVISNTANQAYYVKPNNSTTISNLMLNKNEAMNSPSGDYIYYDRINVGKVMLNISMDGRAIGAGGTISGVTATPNY